MIELGSPWALWALISVPLICLLYWMRPRRQVVTVSSLELWRAAVRERSRSFGLNLFASDPSLLFVLAAAVLLSLALGDPRWSSVRQAGRDRVLIVDTSASMQARAGSGGSQTRMERARVLALGVIDGLGPLDRALVMTSGRQARLRSGFERDPVRLKRIVAGLRASDEPGRPGRALALALSVLPDPAGGEILFLTDGAFDSTPEITRVVDSGRLRPILVGRPDEENVAITAFDLRPQPGLEGHYQVFAELGGFGRSSRQVAFDLAWNGEARRRRIVRVPPGTGTGHGVSVPVVLDLSALPSRASLEEGLVTASISVTSGGADGLAGDDRAYAVVALPAPLRVIQFGEPAPFLESALHVISDTHLVRRDQFRSEAFTSGTMAPDLYVFNRVPPPPLAEFPERARVLLVDVLAAGLPVRDRGWVEHPVVTGESDAPSLSPLDLSGVAIPRARRVERADPGASAGDGALAPRIWSGTTLLAFRYASQGRRFVYLGIDPQRSSFSRLAAFPLFVEKELRWLRSGQGEEPPSWIPAGQPVALTGLGSDGTPVRISGPAGDRVRLVRAGRVYFEETGRSGFYAYRSERPPARVRHFAVTLADREESDLARRWSPEIRAGEEGRRAAPLPGSYPLWPILLVVALVLLGIEAVIRRRQLGV